MADRPGGRFPNILLGTPTPKCASCCRRPLMPPSDLRSAGGSPTNSPGCAAYSRKSNVQVHPAAAGGRGRASGTEHRRQHLVPGWVAAVADRADSGRDAGALPRPGLQPQRGEVRGCLTGDGRRKPRRTNERPQNTVAVGTRTQHDGDNESLLPTQRANREARTYAGTIARSNEQSCRERLVRDCDP